MLDSVLVGSGSQQGLTGSVQFNGFRAAGQGWGTERRSDR